jgi:hypothetical protein
VNIFLSRQHWDLRFIILVFDDLDVVEICCGVEGVLDGIHGENVLPNEGCFFPLEVI